MAVRSNGKPVVVTMYGTVEELSYDENDPFEPYEWKTLWAYPSDTPPQDVAAGAQIGDGGDLVVAALGDTVVDLRLSKVVPVKDNAGMRAVAVAGDGTKLTVNGKKLPRLWAVGNNGLLYSGDESGLERVTNVSWGASIDAGVDEQGMPCVVAADGNAWQLDTSSGKWLNARGVLKAIAAGPDRSMWMVGQDGRLYNRGWRRFGFWGLGPRARPAPGETWCEYEAEEIAFTPLVDELANRFAEGGASLARIGQFFADPDGNDTRFNDLGGAIPKAAELGLDVFVLFDVIRTNERVVSYPEPNNVDNKMPPGADDFRKMAFDDYRMVKWFNDGFDAFRNNVEAALKQLAPGLSLGFEDVIKWISIGGEIDVYLNTHNEWEPWLSFYHQVREHIRKVVPPVQIGSVLTLHYMAIPPAYPLESGAWGMFKDANGRQLLGELYYESDYVGFTSYPDMFSTDLNPADDVVQRINEMLEIAGYSYKPDESPKPVIVEEFGYPTYDGATIQALQKAWPDRGVGFPASFFSSSFSYPFGDQIPKGVPAQTKAIDLAFEAWDAAKLRLPVFIWFTAFEQHIEGDGCKCTCLQVATKTKSKAVCDMWGVCEPCVQLEACKEATVHDPACHPCGALDGESTLGLPTGERAERFFGSCGLIRSDGVPKLGWNKVVALTTERKASRGI